ncbi:hypothetical protein PENTCL1PPCAC_22977, partial [Pristionchus entomophagus]
SSVALGVVVEKSSDFDAPTFKVASKGVVNTVNAENAPSVVLGDWVLQEFDGTITKTKKIPLSSRVLNKEKVQIFSYVTIIPGHCSMRDLFIPPPLGKVWSPHFGFAYSEITVMYGLKDDILYEAWFEYRNDRGENEPIYKLKTVGKPLIDPSKTILLTQTPWKLFSRRIEVVDNSLSAVLHSDRPEEDRYHHGMVIALINTSERLERGDKREVVLHSPSYGGIVTTDSKRMHKSVYDQLTIGRVVKFRERTDTITNEKYQDIKEILLTPKRDIQFEKIEERNNSWIRLLASVGIDDDLLEEETEGTMKLICDYGRITVAREKFAKLMEEVLLEKNDLVEAKNKGEKLLVWIKFIPVSSSWNILQIHNGWVSTVAMDPSISAIPVHEEGNSGNLQLNKICFIHRYDF